MVSADAGSDIGGMAIEQEAHRAASLSVLHRYLILLVSTRETNNRLQIAGRVSVQLRFTTAESRGESVRQKIAPRSFGSPGPHRLLKYTPLGRHEECHRLRAFDR